MSSSRILFSLCLALVSAGCIEPMQPGEFGTFRWFGQVRGGAPIPMLPPTTDREGNVYVFRGDPEIREAQVFAGRVSGGWSGGGCTVTRSDFRGVHGWVGRAQSQVWYWSGDALVGISGRTGDCDEVLSSDPNTKSQLFYRAIFPWVRDIPSRKTVVALIQSAADDVPFQVVVDLENDFFRSGSAFSPAGAKDVTVLGVGADPVSGEGYLLVRYLLDGLPYVEGRYVDQEARTLVTVPVQGGEDLPAYAIKGYLQSDSTGRVAGLDGNGNLVVFDRSGGSFQSVEGMTAVGVHPWKGALYLVGTTSDGPVVARLNGTTVGEITPWKTSQAAMAALSQPIVVEDDRNSPRRKATWDQPVNGTGPFPLVHALPPDRYADGTTGWLVAGPSFDFGGNRITAVAFAPLGISYP